MKELSLQNTRLDKRYDIQNLLGRGSYAEIYVARDTAASPQSPHSLIVIKALNVFMQNDLDADLERTLVENFQNEAVALDRVRHPNVINRLGHGTARDLNNLIFHYLVLEYLPGGDLAKLCRERKLTLSEALYFLEQVCAGLGHAHKNGIIHRDIKPQNLLLTADRKTVKIADFGVARLSQSDSPITRVGTNMFAPPEHSPMLSGNTGTLTFNRITPAADIYSLAKTAYVLITGESPRFFANQPVNELPFAFRQRPWAETLINVLNKATQNDATNRQQDVNDFWKDLSQIKFLAETDDGDTATEIKSRPHTIPQPRVAPGYMPLAPQQPRFNTSRELKLNNLQTTGNNAPLVVRLGAEEKFQPPIPQPPVEEKQIISYIDSDSQPQPPKQKKFVHRVSAFLLIIGLFAGILFATHNYLGGRGILPEIRNPFKQQTGTASGDVFLRSAPNTNNAPIGIVTRNSRLRIVNSRENWYQVDIIEHGRPKERPEHADSGWVSGKYIQIEQ